MNLKHLTIIILAAALIGCNGSGEKDKTVTTASTTGATTTGTTRAAPAPTLDQIPASLKHEAYEYYGLGNTEPMDMQVTRSDSTETTAGTQRVVLKEIKDGEAIFEIERTGGLSALGNQLVAVRPEGVFVVGSATPAITIETEGAELPSELTPGKTWDYSVTLKNGETTQTTLKAKSKVKGMEKVKVGSTEREALAVEASGSGNLSGQDVQIKNQSWYVKGRGGVKSILNYTMKNGQKITMTIEEVAAN